MTIDVTVGADVVPIDRGVFVALFENSVVHGAAGYTKALDRGQITFKDVVELARKAEVPYPLLFAPRPVVDAQLDAKTKKLLAGVSKDQYSIAARGSVELRDVELIVKDLLRKQELYKKHVQRLPRNPLVGCISRARTPQQDAHALFGVLGLSGEDLRAQKTKQAAVDLYVEHLEAAHVLVARSVQGYMPQPLAKVKFSGANVAIVLLLGVHAVRWTRCPRMLTLLAGIAAAGAYLLLVGPDPSILRATVMGVLGGISVAAGRGGSSGSALWVGIVVLLTVDPSLGADAGFVLSVAATAGIILQGPAVCRLLCGVAWRWLAEALAISIVASLWCLPYLVHLSGFWGPWTVPANVLAAPAVPLGTVCGLLAVCCSGVGPLADPLLLGAGVCARWIEAVAHGIGQAPAARVPTGDGPGAVVVAGLLAGLAAVALQLADPARRATMKELPDSLRASLAAEEEGPPCPRAAAAPRPTRPPGAAWNRPP